MTLFDGSPFNQRAVVILTLNAGGSVAENPAEALGCPQGIGGPMAQSCTGDVEGATVMTPSSDPKDLERRLTVMLKTKRGVAVGVESDADDRDRSCIHRWLSDVRADRADRGRW